jgi:hypothetical protein
MKKNHATRARVLAGLRFRVKPDPLLPNEARRIENAKRETRRHERFLRWLEKFRRHAAEGSLRDNLLAADTPEAVRHLIARGDRYEGASSGTRRKWAKAVRHTLERLAREGSERARAMLSEGAA